MSKFYYFMMTICWHVNSNLAYFSLIYTLKVINVKKK